MDRKLYIQEQFELLFKEIAVPVPIDDAVWRVMDVGQDPIHLPFGYRPPEWNALAETYWVFYSADIINRSTENETDDRFITYLASVIHHLHYHIIFDGDVPFHRIDHAIDEAMYDLAPGSLMIMNDIQMAYLDQEQK